MLKCVSHEEPCDEPAKWYVWYETANLLGDAIYTYKCDKHLYASVKAQDTEHPIVQITPIDSPDKLRSVIATCLKTEARAVWSASNRDKLAFVVRDPLNGQWLMLAVDDETPNAGTVNGAVRLAEVWLRGSAPWLTKGHLT